MEIHSFVPRFRSLRWAISSSLYGKPFDRFMIPGYPSGATSGKTRASQIAKMIARYFKDFPKPEFHIYEVGASSGMLSLHVMDALKSSEFYLYQMIHWHIIDPSHPRVDRLSDEIKRHPHAHKIEIHHGDARQIPELADGIILSMALSTLPARHIVKKNNQIFEAVIRSRVDDDIEWTDTSQYPAQTGTAQTITDYYLTGGEELVPDAETILNHLTEEWTLIEATIDGGWHPKELETAKEWTRHEPEERALNFSGLVTATINECFKKISPTNGFILIEDAFDPMGTNCAKLMAHYRSGCAFKLPFHTLSNWIQGTYGHATMTTQWKDEGRQIQLILPKTHSLTHSEFNQFFSNSHHQTSRHLLKNLRTIKDPEEYLAVLDDGWGMLDPDEIQDHDFTLCIGLDLAARNRGSAAIPYVEAAIRALGPMAFKAQWLRAVIHRQQFEYEAAKEILTGLLNETSFIPAVVELIRVYQDMRQPDLAAEIAGRYYDRLGKGWNQIAEFIGK